MTIHAFKQDEFSKLRSLVLSMEQSIDHMVKDARDLETGGFFFFQLGKTAQAAQSVCDSIRDFIQQSEALEKEAKSLGLKIGDEK